MGAHAILSPSSAYRWMTCTPSARFEEQIPEEGSSYAEEGTLAHKIAAELLIKTQTARYDVSRLDALKKDPIFSTEMWEHCNAYADYVRKEALGSTIYVEREYDMSKYIPLQFGTADASFIKNRAIHVVDLKFGAGVGVTATMNRQMMCYALGAYEAHQAGWSINKAVLHIFQPRAGGVSKWEISIEDLLQWANTEARPKGLLAVAGEGEFVAGKHCQFCRAKTRCRAYYLRFAELKNIRDKREMSPEELAEVLTHGSEIASWAKKVEEDSVARLEKGEAIKGFKLVAGKGRRSFKNEDNVVDILLGEGYDSDTIFKSSLCTLTELEKSLGKKRFGELFENEIIQVPGKNQIVPDDDNRPAIGASAANEYD